MTRKVRKAEFEIEELKLKVKFVLGRPLSFCELYDSETQELLTYGVANYKESPFYGLPYSPTIGAKMSFKSALNKYLPTPRRDDIAYESVRNVRTKCWEVWKSVFPVSE